jgi:Holliday junction resolvasome RuvABC DNA-binding subunit
MTLMVSLEISRNRIDLYAFRDAGERDGFRELTAIPGVGGVTALKLLPHVAAVRAGRFEELPSIPGIGPAKRARLSRWLKRQGGGREAGSSPRERDLREALEALGLEPGRARTLALKGVTARPGAAVEDLVRAAVAGSFDGEAGGRKGRKR